MKPNDFSEGINFSSGRIESPFFNFSNAITAAYYAKENLEIQKVNKNFLTFFPILGNVKNVMFHYQMRGFT